MRSLQKLHNGQLNIIPNLTSEQRAEGINWEPMLISIDQWPGSKDEIKYVSNSPLDGKIVLCKESKYSQSNCIGRENNTHSH